jgi:hypothetical protein
MNSGVLIASMLRFEASYACLSATGGACFCFAMSYLSGMISLVEVRPDRPS